MPPSTSSPATIDLTEEQLEQLFELPPGKSKAHWVCPDCHTNGSNKHGLCGAVLHRPGVIARGLPICEKCMEIERMRFIVRCPDCGKPVRVNS